MTPTVLVVDDHPQLRQVIRTMLESWGYFVAEAADGTAALAAFEYTHFDAALIDVDMPGLNGLELVRALRDLCERTGRRFRAALMTGVPRAEVITAAVQAGAARVLAKPFPMAELIATVDQLVRAPSPSSHAA